MAIRKPGQIIKKLRLEAGEDEIVQGSYDQFEPLTSYKLGYSVMAVDMSIVEWPFNGKGIVSTSKADNTYGSQTFAPKGSTLLYRREWNDTLPSLNDDFEGGTLDLSKWQFKKHQASYNLNNLSAYTSNGQLYFQTASDAGRMSVISEFGLTGDFDVEIYQSYRTGNGDFNFAVTPIANRLADAGQTTTNWTYIGVSGSDSFITVMNGSLTNHGANAALPPRYWRITRTGSTFNLYHKVNAGDAWTLRRTGTHTTGDMAVVLNGGSNTINGTQQVRVDNFKINSGTPYLFSGATATWQPWTSVEDANNVQNTQEAYTDSAVSIHNGLSTAHGFNLNNFITAADSTAIHQILGGGISLGDSTAIADALISTHNDSTVAHGFDLATFITATDATSIHETLGGGVGGGITLGDATNIADALISTHNDSTVAHGFDFGTFVTLDATGGLYVPGTLIVDSLAINGTGPLVLTSDTNITLKAGNAVILDTAVLRLTNMTTTQRDTLTPSSGDQIFNSTTGQFEGWNGTSWVVLG